MIHKLIIDQLYIHQNIQPHIVIQQRSLTDMDEEECKSQVMQNLVTNFFSSFSRKFNHQQTLMNVPGLDRTLKLFCEAVALVGKKEHWFAIFLLHTFHSMLVLFHRY